MLTPDPGPRRSRLPAALIITIAVLIISAILCWYFRPRTVIVLRHAEKQELPGVSDDLQQLTAAGHARAQTLAQILARAGVTAIYVTEKLRTQQTAAPLATNSGITPTQILTANVDDLIDDVLAVKNSSGVIVIVGHSDTVPIIVDRLDGGAVTVGATQFDNLFVLTWRPLGATRIIQATYGEPR